jgi:hypothetical protein
MFVDVKQTIEWLLLQWGPTFAEWMTWQTLRQVVPKMFAAASVALLAFVLLWPVPLIAAWDSVARFSSTWTTRLLVTAICGVIGALLYITRRTMRWLYGAAEIAVGLAACWVAIGQSSKSGVEGAITLGSGLYIIVRGFDNCGVARAEKRKLAEEQQKVRSEFIKRLLTPSGVSPQNPFAMSFLREAPGVKK